MKLKWTDIRYETREHGTVPAQSATLVVPVRHEDRGSGKIELPVVRLPARTGKAKASVLYIAGGPGESGVDAGRGSLFRFFDALRETRDVILFDQRGAGASQPSLDCDAKWRSFSTREPIRSAQMLARILERSMDCADRLREAGVDLDAYNSVESAGDVAALCKALGPKPVHAVAHSYGSHLAMAAIKLHPGSFASVVLAGPEGPDHTLKLPSNVHAQLQNIAAASGERGFDGVVAAVLERLDLEPQDVKVAPPPGGDAVDIRIGRFEVEWITAVGLADRRLLRLMPSWFGRMANGDFGTFAEEPLLAGYLRHLRRGLDRGAMSFCMDCASGVSEKRWDQIEREAEAVPLGRTIDFPYPEVALAWQVPDLGNSYRQPPQDETLPVLFVTGGWDCRTPVANLKDLTNGLPEHQHLHVEGAGHTDLLYDPEVAVRVEAFLNGEAIDPGPIPEREPLFT